MELITEELYEVILDKKVSTPQSRYFIIAQDNLETIPYVTLTRSSFFIFILSGNLDIKSNSSFKEYKQVPSGLKEAVLKCFQEKKGFKYKPEEWLPDYSKIVENYEI